MTDPIRPSPLSSYYPDAEGATAAENAGQVSLSSEHPAPSPTPTPPSPPSPAAVSGLVARFQPSLLKAFVECKSDVGALVVRTVAPLLVAPETAGASLVAFGFAVQASHALVECLDKNVEAQTKTAQRERQAADCKATGGLPVQDYAGAVVCLKP